MQQELFEGLQVQRPRGGRLPLPIFQERVLTLRVAQEDLVCGALILLLLMLGGFCVGVERGKQLVSAPQLGVTVHLAEQVEPSVQASIAGKQLDAEPAPAVLPASAPPAPQGAPSGSGYVIQLASYSGAGTAQAQAQRLRSRGVQARVIRQGKYFELRAVGYRSQEEARASLAALRRLYRDAFIKRVSSS